MIDSSEDRTIVSTPPSPEATVALAPAAEATLALGAPERTQMAVSVECPVCHTPNPPGETYCGDCGFLLGSVPGETTEEASAPQARLTDLSGREFALNPGRNTVGRQSADVLLADGTISRQHAAIVLEPERCWVEDLGSTNGTRVNGERLAPHQPRDLTDGDEVSFGGVALRLSLPEGVGVRAEGETAAHEEGEGDGEIPVAASPARLVLEESGVEYPIPVGTVSVGRRSANQIAFPSDAYTSGRHATLAFDGETLTLTDAGSTNGTVVNDDRLAANEPVTLHDGDLIVIGQQRLRVRLAPPAAPEDAALLGL